MSKRHPLSIDNVLAWLAAGQGQGEFLNFVPLFKARDVPSQGRTRWMPGVFIPRDYVLFSDIEYHHLILAEYAGFAGLVLDICEQVALLPWELLQAIADQYGIKYPRFPGTDIPYLMSSDLVLKIPTALGWRTLAISIKAASELAHGDDCQEKHRQRVLEKLFLESKFWSLHGAQWILSTDEMLPMALVKNLDFTRAALIGDERKHLTAMVPEFTRVFLEKWTESQSLTDLNYSVSKSLGVTINDAFALFGRGIWLRKLPVDIHSKLLQHDEPVTLILGPAQRGVIAA